MIWQDGIIMIAQGVMLIALIPTLLDRSCWPHPITAAITAAMLTAVAIALGSLGLWMSTAIVGLLAAAWGWMAYQK